ncbi:hypothetical protein ACIFOT_04480 [Neobacillus sp. NRS-1170]|uniref:hypothetical protein n=1 Tax=Neobacillus sp. NRS-1170 TaxID=3233898 RepID=UPI003D27FE7F
MLLRKMVEEFETIKKNMTAARKQYGNHHHSVSEYRNQLYDLYNRYFGENITDNLKKKNDHY